MRNITLNSIYYQNSTFEHYTTEQTHAARTLVRFTHLKGQVQLNNRTEINTQKELKRTSNLSLNSETLVYASLNKIPQIVTHSTNQHLLMMQLAIIRCHTNWSPFTTVWAWANCTDTVDSTGIEASDLILRV